MQLAYGYGLTFFVNAYPIDFQGRVVENTILKVVAVGIIIRRIPAQPARICRKVGPVTTHSQIYLEV